MTIPEIKQKIKTYPKLNGEMVNMGLGFMPRWEYSLLESMGAVERIALYGADYGYGIVNDTMALKTYTTRNEECLYLDSQEKINQKKHSLDKANIRNEIIYLPELYRRYHQAVYELKYRNRDWFNTQRESLRNANEY